MSAVDTWISKHFQPGSKVFEDGLLIYNSQDANSLISNLKMLDRPNSNFYENLSLMCALISVMKKPDRYSVCLEVTEAFNKLMNRMRNDFSTIENDKKMKPHIFQALKGLIVNCMSEFNCYFASTFMFNKEQVDILSELLLPEKCPIIEVGGGSGLCANLLKTKGFDIISCDKFVDVVSARVMQPVCKLVQKDAFAFITEHRKKIKEQGAVLLMLAPDFSKMAYEALRVYETFGGSVVIVGGHRSYCATVDFWAHIDAHYQLSYNITGKSYSILVDSSNLRKCEYPTDLYVYEKM